MVRGVRSHSRRATRVGATVRLVLRSVAVLLLGASAVLGAQAAWSRFAVCFVDTDPPVTGAPADHVLACFAMQDNLYNYREPHAPWVPIADAAQREGLSLLALSVAVALVAMTVADRWFVRVIGVVVAPLWLVQGIPTLLSGLAGEPVTYDAVVKTLVWLLLLAAPIMIGLGLRAMSPDFSELGWDWRRGEDDGLLIGLFWVALVLAHPLVEFMAASLLWSSVDTSPLYGLIRCAAAMIAAAAVAATLVPKGKRPRLIPFRRPRARLPSLDSRTG